MSITRDAAGSPGAGAVLPSPLGAELGYGTDALKSARSSCVVDGVARAQGGDRRALANGGGSWEEPVGWGGNLGWGRGRMKGLKIVSSNSGSIIFQL